MKTSVLKLIPLVLILLQFAHCTGFWTQKSRTLASTKPGGPFLIVTANYSINITNNQGEFMPLFKLSKSAIEDKINNKTLDDVFVWDENTNYFTLQFKTSAHSSLKAQVTSDNALKVRLVTIGKELHDISALTFEKSTNSVHYQNKFGNTNMYVQFLCKDNAPHPVTFHYAITENKDDPLNGSSVRNFTVVKKCRVGKNTDFTIRLNDSSNSNTSNIFPVSELTNTSNSTKLVILVAGPILEIMTMSILEQPIMGLELKSLNEKELKVELNQIVSGLISKNHSIPFRAILKCKLPIKENTEEYLVPFELSFHVPPYDDVHALMYADCNKVRNFERSFPLTIETARGQKDVIEKGDAKHLYHVDHDGFNNHLMKIPEDVGASEFFIYSDFSAVTDKANYTTEVAFDEVYTTRSIHHLMPEILDISTTNLNITVEPKRFVLEYNCESSGSYVVKVTFQSKEYKYDFSLIKICTVNEITYVRPSKLLHLLLVVVAVGFGIYLITIFKRLLVREKSKLANPQQIRNFNFRGTQMTSRTIAPLDDSLESDVRDF